MDEGMSHRSLILLALAVGCAPEAAPLGTPVADELGEDWGPDEALPPPTSVSLTGPAFAQVGAPFTLDVSGADGGERVLHIVGGEEGIGPCPMALGGYCLGLNSPVSFSGAEFADGAGETSLDMLAPPWVGAQQCFQAVIVRGPGGIHSALSEVLCMDFCAAEDDDGDGVCDTYDVCPGFDDTLDEDGDGIPDDCDAQRSCQELLDAGLSEGDGDYVVDPDGDGPLGDITVTCDMTTEGGGYTYYAIDSGVRTYRSTDPNDCKDLGMDIVYPRSRDHWVSMMARYDTSYFSTIPGVTKPASGGNYTWCAMNSESCPDYGVGDGGRWWLRATTYSEPNGDYTADCWLSQYDWNVDNIRFNDGGCSYSTTKYICSTNDKP
jgi:hypothetical protein